MSPAPALRLRMGLLEGDGRRAPKPGNKEAGTAGNPRRPLTSRPRTYGQPAAYLLRKHAKSSTLRMGGVVEPSQLAYVSPAAYLFRKHAKSRTFRVGAVVLPSQLA